MNLPLNIDFTQILLHLFNLMILYVVMYVLLYKPVKNFMEKRKSEYEGMENSARDKVKEADELKAEYEKRLLNSEEEIASMRHDAYQEIEKTKKERLEEAEEEAKGILDRAKLDAQREREALVKQAQKDIAGLATEAVEKIIARDESEVFDRFLSSALKENNQDGKQN